MFDTDRSTGTPAEYIARSSETIGEMFLNFVMHEELRSLCGVDLTHCFGEGTEDLCETWHQAAMGVTPSPCQAVQGMAFAREVTQGNKDDAGNTFWWSRVRLDLPEDERCDPTVPWVSKVRSNGTLAADLFVFVDDL